MKNFAKNNCSKSVPPDDGVVIKLDEVWHFRTQEKASLLFGRPTSKQKSSSSIGNVTRDTLKPLEKCTSVLKSGM